MERCTSAAVRTLSTCANMTLVVSLCVAQPVGVVQCSVLGMSWWATPSGAWNIAHTSLFCLPSKLVEHLTCMFTIVGWVLLVELACLGCEVGM